MCSNRAWTKNPTRGPWDPHFWTVRQPARTPCGTSSRPSSEWRTSVTGDLATASGLANRVTVLARVRTALDAELGRSLSAAECHDVLPHTPATHLNRSAAWTSRTASTVITAARFAQRHPALAEQWRTATLSTDVVATLARGLRGLPALTESQVVRAVAPELPKLSIAGVKLLVGRALDLLHPDDREASEQTDYDRRRLVATSHGGMTMIDADLPGLEGQAVMSALDALAESLRVAGDRLTKSQRRADALITLVNRAASHGDLPTTTAGLPVALTVTMGAAEADRIARREPRAPAPATLDEPAGPGQDPTALATTATPQTLGDAAAAFVLCSGTLTGALVSDDDPADHPITATLTRTRVQPLAMGRATRLATPAQRAALALRDGGCLLCDRPPSECQTHHVRPWAQGGRSDLENLVLLCWAHHRQVDLERWTIARNPDRSPGASHWIVSASPSHRWRRRAA
ncbi:MAG: DUF222 domain-containing protein [Candidatus Nanopelagicales bacterium]